MLKTDTTEYLTVAEFASLWNVTPQRVYAMCGNGDLVHERDKWSRILIPRSELERKIDEANAAEAMRGRGNNVGPGHKGLRRAGRPKKAQTDTREREDA